MFAVGMILFLVVSGIAAITGNDAPDWLKVGGGLAWAIGVCLMAASLAMLAWRALP